MSIELLPGSLSYVYKATSEDARSGQTHEVLERAYEWVERVAPIQATDALMGILDNGLDPQALKEGGRFLICATYGHDDITEDLLGIMYAEGEGELGHGGFALVKRDAWLNPAATAGELPVSAEVLGHIHRRLLWNTLHELPSDGMQWGVPVERLTRLATFTEERPLPTQSYGRMVDMEAVSKLSLPQKVVEAVRLVVATYHDGIDEGLFTPHADAVAETYYAHDVEVAESAEV